MLCSRFSGEKLGKPIVRKYIDQFFIAKMSITSVCRSCLMERLNMLSIFEFDDDLGDKVRYSEVIKKLTNIEIIAGDGLPEKICYTCSVDLKKAAKFIDQLKISDCTLRDCQAKDFDHIHFLYVDETKDDLVGDYDMIVGNNNEQLPSEIRVKTEQVSDDEIPLLNRMLPETDNVSDNDDKSGIEKVVDSVGLQQRIRPKRRYTKYGKYRGKYQCDICKNCFCNQKVLDKHKTTHLPVEELTCKECAKVFKQKMYLKIHMRSHYSAEERSFACEHCDKRYAYQYQLTQHQYQHTDEKPYLCQQCGKGCVTRDSLKRHARIHDANYRRKSHTCKYCGKSFPYPSFLAEHMKNHTGERPFLCSYCGKGFRQKGALDLHVRMHTGQKPYKCELCGDSFVSPAVLRVHIRKHTNERPYSCDICGKAFRQATDMRAHRRIHSGIKPAQCTVCHKKMSTTGQLTIHMRMHTGEKPFKCSECNKPFATRTMVQKHMRVHTGERPYMCRECGRAFSQSSSLKTHMKIHERTKIRIKDEMCNLIISTVSSSSI